MRAAVRIAALFGSTVLLALGPACAQSDRSAGEAPPGGDTGMTASDPSDDDVASTDTAVAPEPVWWGLDGALAVVAGEVDPTSSSLTVSLLAADLSTVCTTTRALLAAEVLDPAPDGLHALWSMVLDVGDGCDDPVPETFELGLGPYDRQLDPALAPTGLDGDALFGLYLRRPGEPLFVFGIGGTPAQLDGTVPEVPPLPDGLYTLDGLHVLPL